MRRFASFVASLFALCATLHVTTNVANAQGRRKGVRSDSLINAALARAADGDTAQALDMLERANKVAPDDPETLYWRGLLLARTTVLGFKDIPRNVLAWHLLNKAADRDPTNARYLIEMARIRLKTPLMRLDAERLFKKALAVAEKSGDANQVADVAYELGLNEERVYRTAKDKWAVNEPGTIFNWDDALHKLHYTKEFLTQLSYPLNNAGFVDRSQAEELYRRSLGANPAHELAAIGLMGLLYDQKRYREMTEIARPFIIAGNANPRIRLASGLASYRQGKNAEAEKTFTTALALFSIEDRDDLLNVGRIAHAGEASTYNGLSANDRLHTDSAYWEAADPILTTPENEARLEYLARVAYADLSFTDAEFRQIGWRTDRGLIILRHGEPPTIAVFDNESRVLTVWYYPLRDIQYVFDGPLAMNYASFAGDMRGYAEQMREDHPFMVDNVALAAVVDTVPMQISRFKGTKPGTSTLVVAAKVDVPKLYSGVEIDRSSMEVSLRVGQPSRMKLTAADTVAVTLPATGSVMNVWKRELPTGPYRIRVEAFDRSIRSAAGRAQNEVPLESVRENGLVLSDLLIAQKSGSPDGAISGLDDPTLKPRAELTIAPGDLFSVYWENYGLKPDAQGRVSFDVRVQVTLLEINRTRQNNVMYMLGNVADAIGVTQEGNQTLGLRYHRDETLGGRDRVPQILSIGLGSSPAGTYKVEFVITDKNAGTTARSERILYKGLK